MNQHQNFNSGIPHNQLAEEAFLSHLLTEPDEIFTNEDTQLQPEDFHDPRHQVIYESALNLNTNYERVNLISIISDLQRLGRLHEAGGLEYIKEIVNPTKVTNFGTNPVGLAILIKDERTKRDLMNLSLEISGSVQSGSGLDGGEALISAEGQLNEILRTQSTSTKTQFHVKESVDDVMQKIRNLADTPEGSTPMGVPTGFDQLDHLTTGFKPGQFIIIAARPGIGKALDVNTLVQTGSGMKPLSKITCDDTVFGSDGRLYPVLKAHAPFKSAHSYKVGFSDGTYLIADEQHDWVTVTNARLNRQETAGEAQILVDMIKSEMGDSSDADEYSIYDLLHLFSGATSDYTKTLKEVALRVPTTGFSYAVVDEDAAEMEHEVLTVNLEITVRVFHSILKHYIHLSRANGIQGVNPLDLASDILGGPKNMETVNQFLELLNGATNSRLVANTSGEARVHTPMYSKLELLTAVLQSLENSNVQNLLEVVTTAQIAETLLDESGKYNHSIPYASTLNWNRPTVAEAAAAMLQEAGSNGRVICESYEEAVTCHSLAIQANRVAHITHHFSPATGDEWIVRHFAREEQAGPLLKKIVSVEEVEPTEVRCLSVGSPDETFLAGESLTVTHNSTLAVDFARSATFLAGKTVMFFSLEMSSDELVTRILSAEARVESNKLKRGDLNDEDWGSLTEARDKLNTGNFIIDASMNMTVSHLRAAAMKQKMKPEGLHMVVIDYLQLLKMNDKIPRQQAVSDTSRELKVLSQELEVPIIILSQLNRKSEERQDGKPMLSDLRESGSLEQDADMVFLLHRPESNNSDDRPGETDLIIAKHRGGETGIILLTSMLQYSKFVPGSGIIQAQAEELEASGIDGPQIEDSPW